jgi:hypothetical protein
MIEIKKTEQLLERLGGLQFFPRNNPEAMKDLGKALMSADNVVIAVSVVDDWIKNYRQAPTPADLYRLIAAGNEKVESVKGRMTPECTICDGTGQEIVWCNGYSGARTCVCRNGATA